MGSNGRILGRFFLALSLALLLPVWAHALEAGIEESFVKIITSDADGGPPPDVNTLDANEDGVADRAQFRLLDTLLREDGAPHHAEVLAAYQANLARIVQDNTLGWRCAFMEAIYFFTCDDFNRHCAGTFTLAEPVAIQRFVAEFAESAQITLDPANYNVSLAGLLPGGGDLDGDGSTNAQEFAAVCGNMDAYVSAVKDPALNPATLPCCANCVLQLIAEPQDAKKYTNDPLTLSVVVKDAEGPVHYQWHKGNDVVGADAPELAFSSLEPADSGQYWCVIADASETVTSRTAQVTVAAHMAITNQPLSAKRHLGETHAFKVAVSGGLAPLHCQWFKDGNTIDGEFSQLVLADIAVADAGTYRCVFTDLCEQVVSEHFELVVLQPGEGEDEGVVEGEGESEGEAPIEGETVIEGEIPSEGEIVAEGEVLAEGEVSIEGEVAGEGEGEGEGEIEVDTGGGCAGGSPGNIWGKVSVATATSLVSFYMGWRSGTR